MSPDLGAPEGTERGRTHFPLFDLCNYLHLPPGPEKKVLDTERERERERERESARASEREKEI